VQASNLSHRSDYHDNLTFEFQQEEAALSKVIASLTRKMTKAIKKLDNLKLIQIFSESFPSTIERHGLFIRKFHTLSDLDYRKDSFNRLERQIDDICRLKEFAQSRFGLVEASELPSSIPLPKQCFPTIPKSQVPRRLSMELYEVEITTAEHLKGLPEKGELTPSQIHQFKNFYGSDAYNKYLEYIVETKRNPFYSVITNAFHEARF
jgi:hypothetical protein